MFLVNVPVGLLALVVGWRRLPIVPGQPVPRPDLLSSLLITGGVGAFVLGLVKGGSWGWGDVQDARRACDRRGRAGSVRGATPRGAVTR